MSISLLKKIGRTIAPQRTISLYQDQEDTISRLNKEYGLSLKFVDVVREGVDLALKQLTDELEKSK